MAIRIILAYFLLFTHACVTAGPFLFSLGNHQKPLPTELKQINAPSLHAPYSVISTIVLKQNSSKTRLSWDIQSGCMLVSEGDAREAPLWCGLAEWNSKSLPLWNTLALLSDLIIVVVESSDLYPNVPPDCIQALVDGFRQRVHAAGLPKGRVVILRNHLATAEELANWKEQLDDSGKLSALSSDLLQLLFMASGNSFQQALQDATWDSSQTHGISNLLNNDVEAFAPLLQRVFQAKGGMQEERLLQKQVVRSLLPPRLTKETQLTAFDLGVRDTAIDALLDLQSKQEESWLDSESSPLDFSSFVDPILEMLAKDLSLVSSPQANRVIERQVREKLIHLYEQHVRSLRDYFGTTYESLLDENIQKPAYWSECAQRVKSAFEQRASDSIPAMIREDGIFHHWQFDYRKAMDGLIQDMVEITELRKQESDDEDLLTKESAERRIPKWAEQLAARALMIGVNYIQGWLALQGIRQAALERERNLPKFPLF